MSGINGYLGSVYQLRYATLRILSSVCECSRCSFVLEPEYRLDTGLSKALDLEIKKIDERGGESVELIEIKNIEELGLPGRTGEVREALKSLYDCYVAVCGRNEPIEVEVTLVVARTVELYQIPHLSYLANRRREVPRILNRELKEIWLFFDPTITRQEMLEKKLIFFAFIAAFRLDHMESLSFQDIGDAGWDTELGSLFKLDRAITDQISILAQQIGAGEPNRVHPYPFDVALRIMWVIERDILRARTTTITLDLERILREVARVFVLNEIEAGVSPADVTRKESDYRARLTQRVGLALPDPLSTVVPQLEGGAL